MANAASSPSSEATTVLTIRTGAEFNQQLIKVCEQRGWVAQFSDYASYLSRQRRAALNTLRGGVACVAFIGFDQDVAQAVETAEYLADELHAQVSLIAVAQHLDPPIMLAAMRAGCKEFLSLDSGLSALADVLEHVEMLSERAPSVSSKEASVFSLFGAKGGVGTTVVAVHLAQALRYISKKRVLLIDTHVELGDACLYLGLDGSRAHFSECIRSVGRLDSELLSGFVVRHGSGLEVFSSPDTCQSARPFDPDAMARTLEFLRGEYDYIVMDCARADAPESDAILAASTTVYMVTTPEVGSLRNLSRLMDVLTPLDSCREKLQVVMNRATGPEALNAGQIQKAMHLPVAMELASAQAEITAACNLGRPLAPDSRLPLSMQFTRWASTLTGIRVKTEAAKKAKPFLGFLQPSRQPVTKGI